MTHEEFLKVVRERTAGRIEVLSEYEGSLEKVSVKDTICGHEWEVVATRITKNYGCPTCGRYAGGLKRRLTQEEVDNRVYSLEKGNYTFLNPYEHSQKRVPVRHNECGGSYYTTYSDFFHGYRCPHCSRTYKPTSEEFRNKVKDVSGGKFDVEGEYVNNKTKIPIRHIKCGRVFLTRPGDFLNRVSCKHCKMSRGEESVADALDDLGILYEREKLIGGRLRADFFLPEYEAYIEYDGEQHFRPIEFWGGEEAFKEVKYRDEVKNIYWKLLGFPYLRISYREYGHISSIIGEFKEYLDKINEKRTI